MTNDQKLSAEEILKMAVPQQKPDTVYRCRLCGRTCHEIGGYLHRINRYELPAIWECRPSCSAKLTNEEALLMAVRGDEK